MADETARIDTLPDVARQAELTSAYTANMATDRSPYAGVRIVTNGELIWVMQQRQWSGDFSLPEGFKRADLSGADFQGANLNNADLREANLSGASLRNATMIGANLGGSDLSGADLTRADVRDTNLRWTKMNTDTIVDDIRLTVTSRLGDVRWNGTTLLRVDWQQLRQGHRIILGEEGAIKEPDSEHLREDASVRQERHIRRTRVAARAYRGLGRELKDQNLTQEASWCRLSEQRMERRALFRQRTPNTFLAGCGSALLDLVSGYGEIPARTFLSYVVVVFSFAGLYGVVTHTLETKLQPLSWDETLVLSLTSFHGRGFFPGSISLGDWAARLGAVEAIIGLFIELILIATFSRRFLGN